MEKIEALIGGSEKLTEIFGYWPSFHDAEVIEMELRRGDVEPDAGHYVFPVLRVQVHLWEITNEVNSGLLVLQKHTRTTLRFHD